MKLLVVGGTGLLGSHVIPLLQQRGHAVVVTTRDPSSGNRAPEGVEVMRWDTKTPLGYDGTVEGILSFAGANLFGHYWSEDYKAEVRRSRIETTRHLVDWMAKQEHRPSVFVSSNAVGYYGIQSKDIVDEDDTPGNDFLAELCRDWEREAMRGQDIGVRTVVLRSGILLARRGGALGRLAPIFKLGGGGTIGNGRQPFPWISAHDAARVVVKAVEDPNITGPINMVSPAHDTNRAFTKELGHALHRPTILPVPPIVLRAMYGEGAKTMVEGQHVEPRRLEEQGFRWDHPDLRSAFADIFGGHDGGPSGATPPSSPSSSVREAPMPPPRGP